jgi:uncharacterized protein YjbI with pentapeptide repeats
VRPEESQRLAEPWGLGLQHMTFLRENPLTENEIEEHVDLVKEAAPELAEPASSLISAEELPSAADTLAQLFPDEPEAQVAPGESAAPLVSTSSPKRPEPRKRPKRRNILSRLFAPKRSSKTAEPPIAANDEATQDLEKTAMDAPAIQASERAENPEPSNIELSDIEISEAIAPQQEPVPAASLPSAEQALAELFPLEAAELEAPKRTSKDTVEMPEVEAEAEVGGSSESIAIEEIVDATPPITTEPEEVSAPVALKSPTLGDAAHAGLPVERVEKESVEVAQNPRDVSPNAAEDSDAVIASAPAGQKLDEHAVDESNGKPLAQPRQPATSGPYKNWAFDDKLASHKEWIDSHGLSGQRADLGSADLEAADLISVNLRLADLHDANLRAADLLLADLRDACLVRADLEDACLVGANLEAANLEGASLETAMGLVPRQIAGANLRDALLAPQLMEFEAESTFSRSANRARGYFNAVTGASILSWLIIWRTRDTQLVTDSSLIPFLHSRGAAAALPTAELYLMLPVALLCLYVLLHFHLQRVWDAVQELPAIFPDGRTLGDDQPGVISGLMRAHFRWMNPESSSSNVTERSLWLLAAYWTAPLTLLLFWARYLTRQEIHGTLLQALLTAVAAGIAFYATTRVGRPQEKWAVEWRRTQNVIDKINAVNPLKAAGVLALILILFSAGTIGGVPHERGRAPQYNVVSIRRWAPIVLGWLGFDPYADVTAAAISRRPPGWNVTDDQLATVDGARISNLKMRYAQAYEAFLAGAHLWHADFEGAFLSQADLRGADMGQSNLRYALLDQARMYRVNLDRSHLDGADLRRADLREANLSYCSLTNAILADARLEGANLYTSHLDSATLTRANIQRADLRNSYLIQAHMEYADLRGAYLWSSKLTGADLGGAQLESAIFIDADLQGANLGGANLSGTVLNGANLSGTSLEGADLRGALGLTANQVCSSKSRRWALLSDDLQTQVEARCGSAH